jgi:hypothetical protein
MKVNLEAMGLWNVVESGSVERREDRMALAAILPRGDEVDDRREE